MRRLKKTIFIRLTGVLVLVLFVVRVCNPEVYHSDPTAALADADQTAAEALATIDPTPAPEVSTDKDSSPASSQGSHPLPSRHQLDFSYRHPVRGVRSYTDELHDLQEVQYPTARRLGVRPIQTRAEVEHSKNKLVYIGLSPYYIIGRQMQQSIPYLVPRAAELLQHIGRAFIDSVAVKQLPLHTIVVTSALRTEQDAARLRRSNTNASDQSCHRFGTTIDISYRSFYDVEAQSQEPRSAEIQEKLKLVLAEVIRDQRNAGNCWVMYERKQACFHITVR